VAAPKGIGGGRAARESENRSAGAALRAAIWDPIAAALAADGGPAPSSTPIATMYVVPDGALAFVNFAALPDGKDRYLVETTPAIQMLSAERDLLTAGAAPSGPGRALVVGGPDFGTDGAGGAGDARATAPRFPPLPEAAGEAGEVAATLRHAHVGEVSVLAGRAATETAFKSLAPGSRYLHLATHAFWTADGLAPRSGESAGSAAGSAPGPAPGSRTGPAPLADALIHGAENPLAVSGLAFAGANRRPRVGSDPPDDGILTADEVAALDLTAADWVVLSGCDTGLGANAPGEGLLGLQRAFRVAGARALVVSLWQVPDLATREWMKLVYAEARAGAAPAAALRGAARRWIAAQRRDGAATTPAVWGAFIATGPAR
jgi:CHAT domain-containing protein